MKYISLIIFCFCTVSCNSQSVRPNWVKQNIDRVKSCDIIVVDNIKIIKVGDSFTATCNIGAGMILFKADKQKDYVDFGTGSMDIKYFSDSCRLKEDLRSYIKLQMVKYINNETKQKILSKQ